MPPATRPLDRPASILPIRPRLPEKATHDYMRNGTTTLFAAIEVATGKVADFAPARGSVENLNVCERHGCSS